MLSQQGENGERNVRRKPNNYISVGVMVLHGGEYWFSILDQPKRNKEFGISGRFMSSFGLTLTSHSHTSVALSYVFKEVTLLPEYMPEGTAILTYGFHTRANDVAMLSSLLNSFYEYNYVYSPGLSHEEYLHLLLPRDKDKIEWGSFCTSRGEGAGYVYIDPIEEAPVTRKFRFS